MNAKKGKPTNLNSPKTMNDAFIIGFGTVGKATALTFSIPYHFDLKESTITLEEGAKKRYCFICLPTPTDEKGRQDESRKLIHDYVLQLKEYGFKGIIIIRSTVLPGTCKALAEEFKLDVASCPETLSEASWQSDAVKPKVIIVGADKASIRKEILHLWQNVSTNDVAYTDTVTAETLKYALNSFFLTKIIWANQIYDLCLRNGAKYRIIKEVLYNHPWGSKHHFNPVDKGGRGGGGKCFPKDIKALANYSNSRFFKLIDELNDEYLRGSGKK